MTLVDYLVLRAFDLNPRFQSLFPRMDFPEHPRALTCLRAGPKMAPPRGPLIPLIPWLVSAVTITSRRSMLCQWAY